MSGRLRKKSLQRKTAAGQGVLTIDNSFYFWQPGQHGMQATRPMSEKIARECHLRPSYHKVQDSRRVRARRLKSTRTSNLR